MPARIRIASELRKAIYTGEYKSGDELSLTDVAQELGISRTPVREAFQELESEGLITLRMNRGAVVNRIDRKFIQDIFEMRQLMESQAVIRAVYNGMPTEKLLERLYDLRDHPEDADPETYESVNQELHAAIWKAADNHQLQKYLQEMWNGPSISGTAKEILEHHRSSTYEHIQILQFMRDGMAAEAGRAMELHISRSMANILALYPEEEKPEA